MALLNLSGKRLLISKANNTMLFVIAAASFLTVFSLVACKSLLAQRSYQARVISKKEIAKKQLDSNLDAVENLKRSYVAFVSQQENIIGGASNGTAERDGDNARIILDALPSKYDFPALTTSLEKLLSAPSFKIDNISGTDDELAQKEAEKQEAETVAIEVPFQVGITGSYQSIQELVNIFERSIRPFHIISLSFSGDQENLKLEVTSKTYYQPEKKLHISNEVVQ